MPVSMRAYMAQRRHLWKRWLELESKAALLVLENAAMELKLAWEADMKSPNHYPIQTDILLSEIQAQLRGEQPAKGPIKLPPESPPPRRFSDLVEEGTIKAVYEDQNNGSYEAALKIAASRDEGAYAAFRKLMRAVEAAYEIRSYGWEAIPKPRIHFLHRNLLEIADTFVVGLTREGILEFLDDLCPCGRKHQSDAIRKLIKRRNGKNKIPATD